MSRTTHPARLSASPGSNASPPMRSRRCQRWSHTSSGNCRCTAMPGTGSRMDGSSITPLRLGRHRPSYDKRWSLTWMPPRAISQTHTHLISSIPMHQASPMRSGTQQVRACATSSLPSGASSNRSRALAAAVSRLPSGGVPQKSRAISGRSWMLCTVEDRAYQALAPKPLRRFQSCAGSLDHPFRKEAHSVVCGDQDMERSSRETEPEEPKESQSWSVRRRGGNGPVLATWYSCSRKMREKDEPKVYHCCVHLQKSHQHGINA